MGKNKNMKETICRRAEAFVQAYQERLKRPVWRRPLTGFADAGHPYIRNLKELIGPEHLLPENVLSGASVVIACFVPFTRELAETNRVGDAFASEEWAEAYEMTNAMLKELNRDLTACLEENGYRGAVSPEAFTFDRTKLKSNWSHRHFAYAAGLGTFGINNMLITRAGGCGRYTTVVTELDVEPDAVCREEFCLYKRDGSCGVCVSHCPAGALTLNGYDRRKCYEVLKQNARRYTEFGCSYSDADGKADGTGSEVCGKCVVSAPCTYGEEIREKHKK